MSKISKSNSSIFILVCFFLGTVYFFNNLSNNERLFLSYPKTSVAIENKIVPIEIKGGTFFITKEESDEYIFNERAAFSLFFCTLVSMTFAYRFRKE